MDSVLTVVIAAWSGLLTVFLSVLGYIVNEKFNKIKDLDEELVEKYYQELTKDLQANKKDMPEELKVVYKDNDIVVDGRSMREASRNKVLMESRIVEMFKLLVPEDKGFDMETITYKDVDELFPLSIQMQVVEAISEVISFNYTANKEK